MKKDGLTEERLKIFGILFEEIFRKVEQLVMGQREMLEIIVMVFLAKGHILLDGIPGLAKSLAVEAIAQTMMDPEQMKFVDERLDLTGANILVVDEINRVNAKVRKTLLKAMQERQIVIKDTLFYLNQPLMVVATRNPDEGNPLRRSEMDRFMVAYQVPFPSLEDEVKILEKASIVPDVRLSPVLTCRDILDAQNYVEQIDISEELIRDIAQFAHKTRSTKWLFPDHNEFVDYGVSTRAGMMVLVFSRARAFVKQRMQVIREDVNASVRLVFPHRIQLNPEAPLSVSDFIEKILL